MQTTTLVQTRPLTKLDEATFTGEEKAEDYTTGVKGGWTPHSRLQLVKTVMLPRLVLMSVHPSVRLFAKETSEIDPNDAEQFKSIHY